MKIQGIKDVEIDSDGTKSRVVISYLSGAVVSLPVSDKAAAILIRMSLCQQVPPKSVYTRLLEEDEP